MARAPAFPRRLHLPRTYLLLTGAQVPDDHFSPPNNALISDFFHYGHTLVCLTMATENPNQPAGPYPAGQHIIPPPRPSSPATAEFRLNHLMLRIKDPEKSLRFYNDCLGLHVVFIFNAGPWTIYYLGPRDATIASIGTSKGLLELYHIPSDFSTSYTSGNDYAGNPAGVGFGHIGFTVPDVAEAVSRVRSFGYDVVKPLGEAMEDQMAVPRDIVDGKAGPVDEGYNHVFRQLAFVKDPDVSDCFHDAFRLHASVGPPIAGVWVREFPRLIRSPGLLGRIGTTRREAASN